MAKGEMQSKTHGMEHDTTGLPYLSLFIFLVRNCGSFPLFKPPKKQPQQMAAAVKLLFVLLSLCIFVTGRSQSCTLSNIQVQQTNTGGKNGYDPIFEVEVKNLCQCKLMNVSLSSEGFSSSMPMDPKLFRREGGGYLVNDGEGIPSLMAVKFQYAWDRAFKMSPAAFQVSCQGNRKQLLMDSV